MPSLPAPPSAPSDRSPHRRCRAGRWCAGPLGAALAALTRGAEAREAAGYAGGRAATPAGGAVALEGDARERDGARAEDGSADRASAVAVVASGNAVAGEAAGAAHSARLPAASVAGRAAVSAPPRAPPEARGLATDEVIPEGGVRHGERPRVVDRAAVRAAPVAAPASVGTVGPVAACAADAILAGVVAARLADGVE